MNRHKAFTLIELLVVIAIIALLLSILTPALNKAKLQVRNTICLSNLSQIGLAANLYADDNESYIPRGAGGGAPLWFVQFLPYLGHQRDETDYRGVKIYRCPSFPKSGEGMNNIPNNRQTVCFVMNDWTFSDRNDTIGQPVGRPTKFGETKVPMTTAYLADNEADTWRPIIEDENSPEISRCDIFRPSHLPGSSDERVFEGRRIAQKRHKDGANVLMLDWHAKYIATEDHTINLWRDK